MQVQNIQERGDGTMSWEDIFKLDENQMSLKGVKELQNGFHLLVDGLKTLTEVAIATDNEELERMVSELVDDASGIGEKARGIVAVMRQRVDLS